MKAVIGGLDWPPVGDNAMSSDRTITWLVRDCLEHHGVDTLWKT